MADQRSRNEARSPVRLAVVGAGLIGARHIAHIADHPDARLVSIVDPAPAAEALAAHHGARHFASLDDLLAAAKPDGIILASPNSLHVAQGLKTIAAGIPTLVEKPISDDVASGERLVAAARANAVPLLVGHHRRHNPLVAHAKSVIDAGELGQLIAAHAFFWLRKPDPYFETVWRREPGGGSRLINCIHDIDLLRHFLGEIEAVQAFESRAIRGFPVDETTVATLRFANGALGTITISDTIVAPWSWEHNASENRTFPRADQNFLMIGGTHASLAVPRLDLWRHMGERDWLAPLSAHRLAIPEQDPLIRQIGHFARVIRGDEAPLVTGEDGLNNLRVTAALARAAESGKTEAVFG
jgi:predicted dehydrogenase